MAGDAVSTGRPALHADEPTHFLSTVDFSHDVGDGAGHGWATVGPYLQAAPGWAEAAPLLTFADVLIGVLAMQRTAPKISVTADLCVRLLGPVPDDGRLEMDARLVKAGRSLSVGETDLRCAATGRLVATALGSFLASPRPDDVVPAAFDGRRPAGTLLATSAPTLAQHVGVREPAPGIAEIELRPDLHNATESLQGGLVALLGEIAARSACSEASGGPQVVDALDVHYLAAARVGPFRATASVLTPTTARVELRDTGRDDRLVSIVLAGTRAAPAR